MPMGARECNLKIHDNSMHLHLEAMDVSNFGVHHSSRENVFVVMSFTFEVCGNWCFFSILLDCSFMFIHPSSKCPGYFSYIMFLAFGPGNQIYDITFIKFICDLFW